MGSEGEGEGVRGRVRVRGVGCGGEAVRVCQTQLSEMHPFS